MDFLHLVLQREVVIALAVLGAAAVTFGTWLRQRASQQQVGQLLYYTGYGATGTSIVLFILAGLLGVPG